MIFDFLHSKERGLKSMAKGVKRRLTKAKERELTIEEAFDDFIQEKEALNKSAATIRGYTDSFKMWHKYLVVSEMSLDVKDIDAGYVFSFMNHSLNEEMKPTSLNHYLREIRAFLYWCMEKKLCQPFKVKLATEQEVVKETYSDEDMAKLLTRPAKNASFVEWRTWAIVNWIYATGNRAATVTNILIGDVNFTKREIYINATKNNKAMIIPLSPALATVLNEFIRKWRSDAENTDFLFCNVGEEQLTVNALKHSLRDYNLSRDVDITSIHALRHTFAKQWIRNTGDVFRLQKMLGHSSLEMTRRYVNMFSEDLKEGFETYNPLDKMKKQVSRTQRVKRNDD